jgi:beta-lactamase class A
MRPPLVLLLVGLLSGLAGFGAGYLARTPGDAADEQPGPRAAFVQRRSGAFRHINPLLECDLAEDVLTNRALRPFKARVARAADGLVGSGKVQDLSVYFRELNDGLWFSLGETHKFFPASLNKVPLAIALLHTAERLGPDRVLGRRVRFDLDRDHNLEQTFSPANRLQPGAEYTVEDLITRMIAHSDNNAFHLLMRVVEREELERVYRVLRMQSPRVPEDDEYLSVQTFASFFRVLYSATYLSPDASEWLLETLTRSDYKIGLSAGVPPDVPVAHKFGEAGDDGSGVVQLHDCGIVYVPGRPYLLCVMSRGATFDRLSAAVASISRTVYAEVSAQQAGLTAGGAAAR